MAGITILGLGPGDPQLLTRQAWDILSSAPEVWLSEPEHPVIAALPQAVAIRSLSDYPVAGASAEASAGAVQKVLSLGRRAGGVIYAVPGHPLNGDGACGAILSAARAEGVPVRIIAGLSLIEAALSAMESALPARLSLCDAHALADGHIPGFPPDAAALITRVDSRELAAKVQAVLISVYPRAHRISLIQDSATRAGQVKELPLKDLSGVSPISAITYVYVPPLHPGTGLEALQEVVAHLRAPEGCPWDREQTHATLRRHLLEEAYEAIEAMDAGSLPGMREEFGDLLLQIMLNSQIASELDAFNLNDVSKGIHDKIIRRHPHVFGDLHLDGVESVLLNWERLKEGERDTKSDPGGLLEGVPRSLPALGQAQEYQERAARVGFDWPEVQGVLDKIAEEIGEVKSSTGNEELTNEIGDLLFALVNLARWKGIDAESALRGTNRRFKERFGYIEQSARQQGRRLSELTLDEMERLWQRAKGLGHDAPSKEPG